MKRRFDDLQELCDQVYNFVRLNEGWHSRNDICKGINRAKSPHIIDMIEDLTKGGFFVKRQSTYEGRFPMYEYCLGIDVASNEACK